MSEELQQKLRDQLWEVANKLRGNMSASDFMYFTLGFIFYKYLSEKIEKHANDALVDDEVTFKELWAMEKDEDIEALQQEVKTECLENIGYFIEPNFLFSSVIESIKRKENILPMLERSLKRIEDSTLGQDSEEDFGGLFSDIDLASPKLGKTADDKNTLVSNVLLALDDIDFGVEASQEIDILNDRREQEVWFNEVADILQAFGLYALLQLFHIRIHLHCPQFLECDFIIHQRVIGVLLYLLRQILVEDKAKGEIHKVACRHIATQFVGNFPKLIS